MKNEVRKQADKSRKQYRRWTEDEKQFLIDNYQLIGDKELANLLTENISTDGKEWTLKQVEKKRNYLNLHRTPEQLKSIKERNRQAGCWSINHWKRWIEQAPLNTVVKWYNYESKPTMYIKTESGYRKLAHVNWEKNNGAIPKGNVIRHIDGDPLNCNIANLECLTKSENAAKNANTDGRMAWEMAAKKPKLRQQLLNCPEILTAKRMLNQLNRKIKEHGTK